MRYKLCTIIMSANRYQKKKIKAKKLLQKGFQHVLLDTCVNESFKFSKLNP
ncbi:hypothetical protein HN873_002998 [Arachis hypogaea]